MWLISGLVSLLTQPLAWVGVLVAVAIWLVPRRPTAARRLLVASLLGGLLVG